MSTATLRDQSMQNDHQAFEIPKQSTPQRPLSDLDSPSVDQEPQSEAKASPKLGTKEFEETLHKCFNQAALGNAAQLPELLRETRAAGISDDDLRSHLEQSQLNLATGMGDDWGYLVLRSWDNRIHITCETWSQDVTVASVNELFTESRESKPSVTYNSPVQSLSHCLKQRGEELTELEACILDAAQTVHKKFQHGLAVKREQVRRIVMRYHDRLASSAEFKRACDNLNTRGLCRIEKEQFRLIRHAKPRGKAESRYSFIVEDQRHIETLIACNDCCGIGFDKGRNVSARAAVLALSKARHGISKGVFNKRVRELIELGVLEEVPSKGTTAFRLTIEATGKLKFRKTEPDAKQRAALVRAMILERHQDAQQRESLINGGRDLSPLACALVSEVIANCEVRQVELGFLWQRFKGHGFSFTEFRRAVGELVACERVTLTEARSGNGTACFLELMNVDTNAETVPIFYAMDYTRKQEAEAAC